MSEKKSQKTGRGKDKGKGKRASRGTEAKPFVYLEVCLPASQSLRVIRSPRKRDLPLLRKLDASSKKASGCTYELILSKTMTLCLVPFKRVSVTLKTAASEDAMFEAKAVTTTPSQPGGGG